MSKQALQIVVVGGVAGGATAAARARRSNANADITILEKGPTISFANCGLPYHIGGEIPERDQLLVATSKMFWDRFRIRVLTGHTVEEIDRASRQVRGHTVRGDAFSLPYDKLILATGSEPICPDFCQVQADNLFQLWTLDDMDRILARLNHASCSQAVVIGAGFVGLEIVEQLVRRGIQVTLVERLPQVLGPLDAEMAQLIQQELAKNSVQVILNAIVSQLRVAHGSVTHVLLEDRRSLAADLVVVGAGVRPRTELAVAAGLSVGKTGAVTVNEYGQTSDPNVYAVGDMIEYMHGVLEQPVRMPLAGPANRAGRIAGSHAARGTSAPMSPVLGTSIVRVFHLVAGVTGINERLCRQQGLPYRVATIQAPHHASYYPGAQNLTLKLIYSPVDRRVLGAQIVGREGVDKRIDILATLLHFRGTVDDLAGLDLAYAPQFGSAKDAVHQAAFAAQNDLANYPTLAPSHVDLNGKQVVDVRNVTEVRRSPLPGAVHIPVDELAERWEELDPDQPTVVVCQSGKRAHVAASWLRGKGFREVENLNGGLSIRELYR